MEGPIRVATKKNQIDRQRDVDRDRQRKRETDPGDVRRGGATFTHGESQTASNRQLPRAQRILRQAEDHEEPTYQV